jgi:hypothetical protein
MGSKSKATGIQNQKKLTKKKENKLFLKKKYSFQNKSK